ncbi:MAG TPA: dienelactone hydrolase family protein [Candidatus Acidoferrales bacterium]|nr:dienelactone hydrolase family protein [Candidatus Acidoferrales bacterium]
MEKRVRIPTDGTELDGLLGTVSGATGIVVFAHGSGSSRLSPRNTAVAGVLRAAGIATLLFDLLTETEATDRANVFDIDLLAQRLLDASRWVRQEAATGRLSIGYFGASTGAAAALTAAATDAAIRAVVSRGGRPDLAAQVLPKVKAPTLLIVGGEDAPVIRMNREAYALLRCEKELRIVPGATHLFEEPGTLEEVTRLATAWFLRHLHAGDQPRTVRSA